MCSADLFYLYPHWTPFTNLPWSKWNTILFLCAFPVLSLGSARGRLACIILSVYLTYFFPSSRRILLLLDSLFLDSLLPVNVYWGACLTRKDRWCLYGLLVMSPRWGTYMTYPKLPHGLVSVLGNHILSGICWSLTPEHLKRELIWPEPCTWPIHNCCTLNLPT